MITTNDVEELVKDMLDTKEKAKLNLSMTRVSVLVLSSILDRALIGKSEGGAAELFLTIPEDCAKEIAEFNEECLERANLGPIRDRLIKLSSKKKS